MFGIGDDKLIGIIFFDVVYGFFKSDLFFYIYIFVEGQIGFISDVIVSCCIDNCFIESEDGIWII